MATRAEFCALANELHAYMGESLTDFFRRRGIEPDWLAYWQNTTTDHDHLAREIICFAGDLWPDIEPARKKQAA
jgi:hypothetical protein